MTDVISGISESGYTPTLAQLRELAALSVGATRLKDTIGTTYLRALARRARDLSVVHGSFLIAVDMAHKALYPPILEGVTTDDVKPLHDPAYRAENKRRSLERNARSNFARTAASALRKFVAAGGDLLRLDIAAMTKSSLDESGAYMESTPTPPTGDVIDNNGLLALSDIHRKWGRFVRALHKSPNLYNNAGFFIGQLESIRNSSLQKEVF